MPEAEDLPEEENEEEAETLIPEEPPAPEEKPPPGPSFMQLYTSLMMLLMTFFIVLFSMATTSTARLHVAADSVRDEFHNLGLTASKQAIVFIYSYLKIKMATLDNDPERESLEEEETEYMDRTFFLDDFERSSKVASLVMLGLSVERKKDNLIIKIPNHELFYPNSNELTHKGQVILFRVFSTIEEDFENLVVKAYADSPAKKIDEKNNTKSSYYHSTLLGIRVVEFIIKETDIPAKKISFFGNGKYRPIEVNVKKEDDVKINNRIEIWIKGLWVTNVEIKKK